MLARTVLEWCDKKQEEAIETDEFKSGVKKACVSGAVEGFIDGCVTIGLGVLATGMIGFAIGKLKK